MSRRPKPACESARWKSHVRKWIVRSAVAFAIAAVVAFLFALPTLSKLANVTIRYKAKAIASLVFVAGRPESEAIAVVDEDDPRLRYVKATIDHEQGLVKASLFGALQQVASYHSAWGCVLNGELNQDGFSDEPKRQPIAKPSQNISLPAAPSNAFESVLDDCFAEPERPANLPKGVVHQKRTQAILVYQSGRLLAERYAPGFDATSRFCGWSMTKSVLGLLIMMRIDEGALTLSTKPTFATWAGSPNDPRNQITLEHLMRMQSGLSFSESYSPFGDAIQMLYNQDNMAKFAVENPLVAPDAVGRIYSYSSGSSLIISQIFRDSFQNEAEHLNYPYHRLFTPLGIQTALLELDSSGTFVGSSSLYATARDWLKIGLLVLQKGEWQGQQIVQPDSLRFLVSAPSAKPDTHNTRSKEPFHYAAQWWTNAPYSEDNPDDRWLPEVPPSTIAARGHFGQLLLVVPPLDLVIVRLGLSKGDTWDVRKFVANIVAGIQSQP